MSSIAVGANQRSVAASDFLFKPTGAAADVMAPDPLGSVVSFLGELRTELRWDDSTEVLKRARHALFNRGMEMAQLIGARERGPICAWWKGSVAELLLNNTARTKRLTMQYDVETNRYRFIETSSSTVRQTVWIARPYDLKQHVEWLLSEPGPADRPVGLRDPDPLDLEVDHAVGMPIEHGPSIRATLSPNTLRLTADLLVEPFDLLDG